MKTPEQVAEELIGTCVFFDFDDYPQEWLEAFDQLAFECELCEWWCAMDEESATSRVCEDCEDERIETTEGNS